MRVQARPLVLVATASFLLVVYATAFEPYWIEVTRHHVPVAMSPLKIVHLTDLHTRYPARERGCEAADRAWLGRTKKGSVLDRAERTSLSSIWLSR